MTLARHLALSIVLAALPAAPAGAAPQVVIAFHPGGLKDDSRTVFERLAAREDLSVGWLGATQGPYSVRQTVLDISQGSRVSRSGYDPGELPPMWLEMRGVARQGKIRGWRRASVRAASAPGEIEPGLLAASVPGGAGYAGVGDRASHVEAVVAADRSGIVTSVSLGLETDLAERVRELLTRRDLVVAALPTGPSSDRTLDELRAARPPDQLLLVIRTPPRSRVTQLLPAAAIGLTDRGAGLLRSRTTRRDGLVAAHDVLPTVLDHLRIEEPDGVRGRPIFVTASRGRDIPYLRRLERRLRVVSPRRFPALRAMALGILVAGLGLWWFAGRRRALRVSALALMYAPLVSLAGAALAPSRAGELALMAIGTVGLGAVTDVLVRWPRAPAIPALGAVGAYCIDLAYGSPLIVRSLLGPNPRFGARWYGIGNELEGILPVLLLVGLAAVVGAAARSRGLALLFGGAMLVLGAIVGAGRLGADVGGVITIGAGGAAAVLLARPGALSRRAVAVAASIPVLAVGALALIDLVTGGDSHFTATVLGAEDSGALRDVVERRTDLAVRSFLRGLMPVATLLAIAGLVWAWRRREDLLGPVADRPAWAAALAGGVAAGVIGSLANDSGPVLLVVGSVVVLAALMYVRGDPRLPA